MVANPGTKADSRGSREGTPTSAYNKVQAEILQGAHKLKYRNNIRFAEKDGPSR